RVLRDLIDVLQWDEHAVLVLEQGREERAVGGIDGRSLRERGKADRGGAVAEEVVIELAYPSPRRVHGWVERHDHQRGRERHDDGDQQGVEHPVAGPLSEGDGSTRSGGARSKVWVHGWDRGGSLPARDGATPGFRFDQEMEPLKHFELTSRARAALRHGKIAQLGYSPVQSTL